MKITYGNWDPSGTETMYRLAQVAKIFGLHPNTIRKHIRRGTLKAIKLPGATSPYLIPESEVQRFKERYTHDARSNHSTPGGEDEGT